MNPIWATISAIAGAALLASALVASILSLPVELTPIFSGLFFVAFFSLFLSLVIVLLMYLRRIARTDASRAVFATLLILLSVSIYGSFEYMDATSAGWRTLLLSTHGGAVVLFTLAVSYGKSMISFGIGALGSSVLGTVITR